MATARTLHLACLSGSTQVALHVGRCRGKPSRLAISLDAHVPIANRLERGKQKNLQWLATALDGTIFITCGPQRCAKVKSRLKLCECVHQRLMGGLLHELAILVNVSVPQTDVLVDLRKLQEGNGVR